jgi:hypothetical protein
VVTSSTSSKIDKHVHYHEKVVIGSGLNSLLYAFLGGHSCIYVGGTPPFRFDYDAEFGRMGLLGVKSGNLRQIWERLILALSLGGQLPMANKTYSINIQDNVIKAFTNNSRLGRFHFDKLVIFDDKLLRGLPPITRRVSGKSKVIDWYDVRSGMEHEHDFFETAEDFVKEIYFYPSDRFGNQKSDRVRKDLVAVSYLEEDQIKNFEFSDTMAKFKILKIMKELGIKGARNGRDTYNPNIYRYYSPKIESVERQVIPNVRNYYQQDDRFEFRYDTPKEILENFENNPNTYSFKISEFFVDK